MENSVSIPVPPAYEVGAIYSPFRETMLGKW